MGTGQENSSSAVLRNLSAHENVCTNGHPPKQYDAGRDLDNINAETTRAMLAEDTFVPGVRAIRAPLYILPNNCPAPDPVAKRNGREQL
jgi:hypothetical protein